MSLCLRNQEHSSRSTPRAASASGTYSPHVATLWWMMAVARRYGRSATLARFAEGRGETAERNA